MSLAMFLPLVVSVAAPQPSPTGAWLLQSADLEPLEAALTQTVRTRVAAGWQLTDVDGDETRVDVVVSRGGVAEHHIVAYDFNAERGRGGYRIERHAAASKGYVTDRIRAIVASDDGVLSVEPVCGYLDLGGYMVTERATGAAAGRLASRILAGAEQLEAVDSDGDEIVFTFSAPESRELALVVDDAGAVVAAELRDIDHVGDDVSYARAGALAEAVGAAAVTAVDVDDGYVTLHLGKRRFEIDPGADAFIQLPFEEICGC